MTAASRQTALLLVIALFGLGSVGVALWTQHGLGMEPCPWCILQRLIVVLVSLLALLGLAHRLGLRGVALLVAGLSPLLCDFSWLLGGWPGALGVEPELIEVLAVNLRLQWQGVSSVLQLNVLKMET